MGRAKRNPSLGGHRGGSHDGYGCAPPILRLTATLHGVVFDIFNERSPASGQRGCFGPVQPPRKKHSCSQLCAKHFTPPPCRPRETTI
jgi:hypothetical protein